ncbi:hypothetical protein [Jeotgalibacillus sp. JSM ZJ347]|uniref:hypothetical protein n=1 Tax=Jeotgalibacillus sp. JSM ZJ347 TaxID=3342117 RepID=UPI0035A8575D
MEFFTALAAWTILAFWLISLYQKHDPEERPATRKMLLIVLIGLFSFSIDFPAFGEMISLAILPIGVGVAYLVLKRRGRWEVYNRYAWSGFFANYLFLSASLLTIFISSQFYPEGEIETYLDDVFGAELFVIHPSAEGGKLNVEQFAEDITGFEAEYDDVIGWYDDAMEQKYASEPDEQEQVEEKFPYLITGIEAKEGYGVQVYLEADGKGMLVTTADNQYYYRSESASFFEEGVSEE